MPATTAINRAKDNGDPAPAGLREIAEDPHGFILRQGWEKPRLHGRNRTRATAASASRACGTSVLEELAAERAALLAQESAELEGQAKRLAEEIEELGGVAPEIS